MADRDHIIRRGLLKGVATLPLALAAPSLPALAGEVDEVGIDEWAALTLIPFCRKAMRDLTEATENDDPNWGWKLQAAITLARAFAIVGGDEDERTEGFGAEKDEFAVIYCGRTYTLCRQGWRNLVQMGVLA